MNNNIAVLGGAFGDEGKGRVLHYLAKDYDVCLRISGGNNCGHTIYSEGKKLVHHLVPSMDFTTNSKGFLSSEMVIDLGELRSELMGFEKHYPGVSRRVYVDPDAFVILPEHIAEDKAKNGHIGSTNRGVGPAYKSKVGRSGTKVSKFIRDNADIILSLKEMGVNFKYSIEMMEELKRSKVLFEGSQGVLLDLDVGIYPYVSCGSATVGGIYSAGFAEIAPNRVIGVSKAYTSKVGAGPYPTQIFGAEEENLRKLGNEIGATTGRNRDVGWLDLPAMRYTKVRGGITELAITKLDILNGMKTVPVCTSYEHGEPRCGDDFFTAKPVYTNVQGWNDARDLNQVQSFISFVEEQVGLKVSYISFGTGPNDMIKL